MQATGELVAGRELDALVAEKVMGLKPCSDPTGRCDAAKMTPCQCWGTGRSGSDLDLYSTDIAAAWQVVEKMREQGRDINLYWEAARSIWIAESWIAETTGANAETAPLAICRAALRAVSQAE